ncbi:MAG TPA: SGNH/GDSL hydrolase family protein [Candidatus Margulisiibacteriota bacterium]|nr:SGNH/GDSL hydrolase family protein [Candidatus Margulisiibacteriota bacterium]
MIRHQIGAWPFEPPPRKMTYLTQKDAYLKWRFSPGNGRNSLGLRNREIAAKDKGSFRILFLGDSLLWSGDTSRGELYTEVIERELNKGSTLKKRIEVINAGVPGYTTFQEFEFLKEYGWDMQPDFVILGFVFNDVYFKYLHRPVEKSILDEEPSARLHRFDTNSFPGMFFSKSYFMHELAYKIERMLHRLRKEPEFGFESHVDLYLAWKKYGWSDTDNLIGIMNSQLSSRNIPFLIVIFPLREQVDDKSLRANRDYVLYPQKEIIAICRKNRIPFIDLTKKLYENGGIKLFKDYLHLNKEGNDVVGQAITSYLKNNLAL